MNLFKGFIISLMLCLSALAITASEAITNESITAMIKAGVGEEIIISKIKSSQAQFDLSPEGIVKLKKDGAGDNIIKAMMEATEKSETLKNDVKKAETSLELYKRALVYKRNGDIDLAHDMLKEIVENNPGINNYQLDYIDVLLEQSIALKEAKNPLWKNKAKAAGRLLYRPGFMKSNKSNPVFLIIFAKYSWIVEEEGDTNTSLKKALFYKPGNPEALILKGDIYFERAVNKKPESDKKASFTNTAKESFESALLDAELGNERKAYIYYRLGELESRLLNNNDGAKANWEKAVSLAPDSKAGKLAKERLK